MEEQPPQHSRRSYVYESQNGRSKKKLFAIIGGIVIVLLVLIGGIMAFSGGEPEDEEDVFAIPTETIDPTDTPTPTPEEEEEDEDTDTDTTDDDDSETVDSASGLDRADYTVLIQNGSGTAGVAGVLADKLRDLGYTVRGTENADNFEYAETEIHVATGNSKLLDLLESDIEDDYTVGDTTTDYDGDEDAVIIIGAE